MDTLSLCQNSINTRNIIVIFQGQISTFQLYLSGPRDKRIIVCIANAGKMDTFRNFNVNSPTPIASSVNGAINLSKFM